MNRFTLLHNLARRLLLPAIAASMLLSTACASKGLVRREVGTTNAKLEDVQGQVEANQDGISKNRNELKRQDKSIKKAESAAQKASKTAQDALERAVAAGRLAEGKFLFETVLSDDKVRFGFDRADLGDEARAALTDFAAELKAANESVYIEIQGHTDNTGPEPYNLELGEARAEAVRRELNQHHGIALHRMSIISYGETEPVADNGDRDGRAQNRRVVLVVLK